MPRTLSGLKTGEFDTLEVSDLFELRGQMIHSGADAPRFALLKVGFDPPDPTSTTVLSVDGDIKCTGIVSSDGSLLDQPLTFSRTSGTNWTEDIVYDGGTALTVKIPTPDTLTINHGSSTLGTYDTTANSTIDIPEPEEPDSPRTLTVQQGAAPAMNTYDTTADVTITIPKIYYDVLGGSGSWSADICYTASLLSSGFGVSLTSLPSSSKVLV